MGDNEDAAFRIDVIAEDMKRRLTDPGLDLEGMNDVMAEMSGLVIEALVSAGADHRRAKMLVKAMILQTGLYYEVRKRLEKQNGDWG